MPAIIRFVLKETKAQQVHFLGHSMVSSLCKMLEVQDPLQANSRMSALLPV